ncbi:U-scoloptoxin(01)-Cw1a-like [Eriocheir sinensis]|uniref:U-scoloptoxin(01)-Cw1a-like n=1 Tax=Eriocheir sinensis TaxID=95602 RepID=UPI0021C6F8B3|nr:U-scoloptoxin(01)-Cw1a-like [Eriocheir sinensis]XP_050722873.1 U-scoloptoxin(01)-Cw1a-like [Eriocheir sinensis]
MRLFGAPLVVALVVVVTLEAAQETSFSCTGRSYGYYADVEAECEMFHICNNNVKWTFRCPNQTLFNQQYLVCDHTANVDCSAAASLYSVNDDFGKVEDETESPP